MVAWLVNDQLGALGERTFWHDLLGWFPDLEFVGGEYSTLPGIFAGRSDKPEYVIRNATYFPWVDFGCPVISFVQDIVKHKLLDWQNEVIARSDVVVYNSEYTKQSTSGSGIVVPIGTDATLFKDFEKDRKNKPLLFVGSQHEIKGFDILLELAKHLKYRWNLVLKDSEVSIPKCKCYVKVSQKKLCEIMNESSAIVCTSRSETQHLSGIEAGFTNLPIVTTPVGIYQQLDESKFGAIARKPSNFVESIKKVLASEYNVRDYFFEAGLDKKSCRTKWKKIIDEISD